MFLTLNNTDINVKGKKQKGKWKLNITITDIYDFTDLKEIEDYYNGSVISLLGSLANNAAMLSTSYNVVHKYNIKIKFDMEV